MPSVDWVLRVLSCQDSSNRSSAPSKCLDEFAQFLKRVDIEDVICARTRLRRGTVGICPTASNPQWRVVSKKNRYGFFAFLQYLEFLAVEWMMGASYNHPLGRFSKDVLSK